MDVSQSLQQIPLPFLSFFQLIERVNEGDENALEVLIQRSGLRLPDSDDEFQGDIQISVDWDK